MFDAILPRLENKLEGRLDQKPNDISLRNNLIQSGFLSSQKQKYENFSKSLNSSGFYTPTQIEAQKDVYETAVQVRFKSLEREDQSANLHFKISQLQSTQHSPCKIAIQLTNPANQ